MFIQTSEFPLTGRPARGQLWKCVSIPTVSLLFLSIIFLSVIISHCYFNYSNCIRICSCSDSQVQAQSEAITEEDLKLIQERESAIRQLEVQIRITCLQQHYCITPTKVVDMNDTESVPFHMNHLSVCSLI